MQKLKGVGNVMSAWVNVLLSLKKSPHAVGTGRAFKSHKGTCHNKHTPEWISWDVDQDRTLGFPPAASKSSCNERHTVQAFTVPSLRHIPHLGLVFEKREQDFSL